ncbi:PRC-barrel domain-containing protein [Roseibium aggregatum]|uniref:PRC-barrel domain-containing protein n=1 Tax=Roseibium aggregatum TaxID=187304 RepID=A0A939EBC5_9HYPH|nr:PRC-barrel domain-containing protein [Roseibium aggregatum]MBN9669409.1 PRC-barrel domain-containing protein [Roseibium aggregatum]
MLRTLLTSTALVATVVTGAIAAENVTVKADAVDTRSSGFYEFEVQTLAPDATTGFLASNMIGKSVMTDNTDEAEAIGDINDVVIDREGEVRAVIVGVGGFLGLGEKDVAVDFSRLTLVSEADNAFTITTNATREELENAAAYKRPDYIQDTWTTSSARKAMDTIADTTKDMKETVRTEAVDPLKEQINSAANERQDDWTAEKTRVDARTVSTDELIGAAIHTSQSDSIGEIDQVLIGDDGSVTAVIIDVGGFLGFGEKPVAVSYDSLKMFENEDGNLLITAPFTNEQLEQAAEYDAEKYKTDAEAMTLKS